MCFTFEMYARFVATMWIELILTPIVSIFTLWFYVYLKGYITMGKIPAPRMWPLLGTALEFKKPEESMYIFPQLMKRLNSKTIRLSFGFRNSVATTDQKLTEKILGCPRLINKEYFPFRPWLGQGLFTSTGENWRKSRKLITPTFHFKILDQFLDVFNRNGAVIINKFRQHVGNSAVDVFPLMTLCTLDIICETAMGISVNAQSDQKSTYAEAVNKVTNIAIKRGFTPLYDIDWIYKMTQMCRDEQKLLKILHGTTDSVIKARRKKLEVELRNKTDKKDAEEEEFERKKKVPFLDMLLHSTIDGRPLTNKELRDEVSTFMFAGHDTTASAISYALYALSNHQEVQRKVFDEIHGIFGKDKERLCTTADLNEMKYLERVIKESLRIYPVAPLFSRNISEPLDYQGITIPTGTNVIFLSYNIHHDPDYFQDPERFDPERFSPENIDSIKPYSYIPFSAGPRNCVGQRFAMLEMKSLISMILRQFELKPTIPAHQLELRSAIILKSLSGIKLCFEERKY